MNIVSGIGQMLGLQFLRGDVEGVMGGVAQQKQLAESTLDTIKSFVPKVQQSWLGGDADAFASDVARVLVPAMLDLIAAIAGMNINLSKATSIIDQADGQVTSIVNGVSDLFARI